MAFFTRLAMPRSVTLSVPVKGHSITFRSRQLQEHQQRNYSVSPCSRHTLNRPERPQLASQHQVRIARLKAPRGARSYSSELANALVEVSRNVGMGSAAVGLGASSIGIGLVFASFLTAVARNPSYRGQLFSYAMLGFAFVEAMGLFDLMVAMMCKYV